MRIRGTASQIYDKYCALAHDANASGDRIAAENYLQHAEHYYRIHSANGGTTPRTQQKGSQSKQDQSSQDIPGSGPQPDVTAAEDGKSDAPDKEEAVVETKSKVKPDADTEDEVETAASAGD